GDDPGPDARAGDRPQRVAVRVPAVPVADDGDAGGVRRPHREVGATLDEMRAELLPQAEVRPLVEEVRVLRGQEARVGLDAGVLSDAAARGDARSAGPRMRVWRPPAPLAIPRAPQ